MASSSPAFSASKSTLHGVKWSALAMVAGQLLFLARSVVLARLLSREDFGLLGMSATVQVALNMATNFGLTNTIVSGQYSSEEELHAQINTIWTADLIRRLLVVLLLMAAAFPTAKFYNDARLTPILMVTSLGVLVQGFENEGLMLLRRNVEFKANNIYTLVSQALSCAAPVLVALWRRDVWALVWGQLLATMLGVAFSYVYHPFRPRFELDRAALQRSIKFGKWFIVISAMVYVTTTADNIFVGRWLGPATLGGYLVAYNISMLPQNIITRVLSNVLFPVFAALNRGERERLGPAVQRVMSVATALLTLVLVPIGVLAPEIVAVFYGPKWGASVEPLRVLLLPGLFRGMLQNVSPITMGLDRPDLEARSKIAEAILFVAALSLLVPRFGTLGAASASALAYGLAVVVRYRIAASLVPDGFTGLAPTLGTMALSAGGGALAGWAILWPLAGAAPLLRLGIGSVAVWAATGALLLALRPSLRGELKRLKRGA